MGLLRLPEAVPQVVVVAVPRRHPVEWHRLREPEQPHRAHTHQVQA